MIESVCANCGNKKIFEDDKLGKKYKCSSCSNTVVIEKVNATASMQDEVVLEVKEIKMSTLEKRIVKMDYIKGFFVLAISLLIIEGIISALGYNILFTSQTGVDKFGTGHEDFGFYFMLTYMICGFGYMIYVKKIKKF